MRVTWSYREASKHPLADSRNRPAVPRLADCAASHRLLLFSGSLSCPPPQPTHPLICSKRVRPESAQLAL